MQNNEFSPSESFERIFSRWWMILFCMILGGTVGWSFHFFQPPIYEATATLTANVSLSPQQLSQEEFDYAIGTAGALISSTWEKENVVKQAQTSGMAVLPSFTDQMSLEAKQSVWEFHVRDSDPNTAMKLANLWLETAYGTLNYSLQHAVMADQIQAELNTLQTCALWSTAATPSPEPPFSSLCKLYPQSNIEMAIREKINQLAIEKNLSASILPQMTFSISSQASIPKNPILYGQATLTLAGTIIGLIFSVWMVGSHLNGFKNNPNQNDLG